MPKSAEPKAKCSSCGGRCRWSDDAWVCERCGDEWYPEHGPEYAVPSEEARTVTETLPSYTRCTVTWWEDGARCDQQEGHDGDHTYKEHTLVSECAELRAELDAIAAVPEQIRRNITLVADPRWRRLVEQVAELRAERATLAAVRDFATPLQIDHRLGDHTQFSRGWEAAKVRVLAILDGETERPQEADQ